MNTAVLVVDGTVDRAALAAYAWQVRGLAEGVAGDLAAAADALAAVDRDAPADVDVSAGVRALVRKLAGLAGEAAGAAGLVVAVAAELAREGS